MNALRIAILGSALLFTSAAFAGHGGGGGGGGGNARHVRFRPYRAGCAGSASRVSSFRAGERSARVPSGYDD